MRLVREVTVRRFAQDQGLEIPSSSSRVNLICCQHAFQPFFHRVDHDSAGPSNSSQFSRHSGTGTMAVSERSFPISVGEVVMLDLLLFLSHDVLLSMGGIDLSIIRD